MNSLYFQKLGNAYFVNKDSCDVEMKINEILSYKSDKKRKPILVGENIEGINCHNISYTDLCNNNMKYFTKYFEGGI